MKKKHKKIKDFDTVKTFRLIKEKISGEIREMDFDQLSAYLNRSKHDLSQYPEKNKKL